MTTNQVEEIGRDRFAFGDNWLEFIELMDERRIEQAEKSLTAALGIEDLSGCSFLDVGCGSGLFSLAARRLGARVHSFDYDPDSVRACAALRDRYGPRSDWTLEQGSILDEAYIGGLGTFDIVYSWGVLHHTGDMWRAIGAAATLTKPGGSLFISIYNDQGMASRVWWRVKRRYVRGGPLTKKGLVLAGKTYFRTRHAVANMAKRAFGEPVPGGARGRGMSAGHDLVDWIGGFPFEVATPEQIFRFLHERGFQLRFLKTCKGGLGCNEFVFTAPRDA